MSAEFSLCSPGSAEFSVELFRVSSNLPQPKSMRWMGSSIQRCLCECEWNHQCVRYRGALGRTPPMNPWDSLKVSKIKGSLTHSSLGQPPYTSGSGHAASFQHLAYFVCQRSSPSHSKNYKKIWLIFKIKYHHWQMRTGFENTSRCGGCFWRVSGHFEYVIVLAYFNENKYTMFSQRNYYCPLKCSLLYYLVSFNLWLIVS